MSTAATGCSSSSCVERAIEMTHPSVTASRKRATQSASAPRGQPAAQGSPGRSPTGQPTKRRAALRFETHPRSHGPVGSPSVDTRGRAGEEELVSSKWEVQVFRLRRAATRTRASQTALHSSHRVSAQGGQAVRVSNTNLLWQPASTQLMSKAINSQCGHTADWGGT